MRNKLSLRTTALVSVILFGIILAAANIILSKSHKRFDLTRDKIYTVSPELKGLLSRVTDVVNVTLYASPDLPPQLLAPRRFTEDILRELSGLVGGKLRVAVVNPEGDKDLEKELADQGINKQPLQIIGRDQTAFKEVYFHLLIQFQDKSQIIPFPNQDEFEYQLGRALLKVTQRETPSVAFVDNAERSGFLRLIEYLNQQGLRDLFKVNIVDASKAAPIQLDEKTDLMVITASERFTERQLYDIDQFLMRGGKLLAFVQGAQFDDAMAWFKPDFQRPNFPSFLRFYGIDVKQELVQDWESSVTVPKEGRAQGMRAMIMVPYPLWPVVQGDSINRENPALRASQALFMPIASPIEFSPEVPEGFAKEVLLKTTKKADTQTSPPFTLDTPAPGTKMPEKVTQYNLAVSLRGAFESYFTGKDIPAPDPIPSDDPLAALRARRGPTNFTRVDKAPDTAQIVVISSTGAFDVQFFQALGNLGPRQAVLVQENVILLQNLIESMTLGEELARIRSKQVQLAYLKELKDTEKLQVRLLGTMGVPLALVLLGVALAFWRRTRLATLAKEYSR